jgi:hypothetical protein
MRGEDRDATPLRARFPNSALDRRNVFSRHRKVTGTGKYAGAPLAI